MSQEKDPSYNPAPSATPGATSGADPGSPPSAAWARLARRIGELLACDAELEGLLRAWVAEHATPGSAQPFAQYLSRPAGASQPAPGVEPSATSVAAAPADRSGASPGAIAAHTPPAAPLPKVDSLLRRFSPDFQRIRNQGRVESAPSETPARPPAPVPPEDRGPSPAELRQTVERLRLKARGCRWQQERQHLLRMAPPATAEVRQGDQDIIEAARKLSDCYLWMNRPETPALPHPLTWGDVAGCFENTATALELMLELDQPSQSEAEGFEPALRLLAEAQSALRGAVASARPDDEPDQVRVFEYLRHLTRVRRIFVDRYMRRDDSAPAGGWAELMRRIDEARQPLAVRKARAKAFKSIEYHAGQVAGTSEADDQYNWGKIVKYTEDFLAAGGKPSDPLLRGALLPILTHLPDSFPSPEGFTQVRREIDRYIELQSPGSEQGPEEADDDSVGPEVEKLRAWLRGRRVVFIGGVEKPGRSAVIRQAFELKELDWITTREHQSNDPFIPHIRHADTALVLLAIRWSSHSFSDVSAICKELDKPLVKLPRGYGVAQIAHEVIKQASGWFEPKAAR